MFTVQTVLKKAAHAITLLLFTPIVAIVEKNYTENEMALRTL
jgi:hypothetical protein